MSTIHFETTRESLIEDIKRRCDDKIIEKSNADLLIKLINNAEDLNEAINIAALGTTYKRTGFHFDKRLEKMTNTIKYFKKNNDLSFSDIRVSGSKNCKEESHDDKCNGEIHEDNRKGELCEPHKLIIGDNYDALQNLLIEYKGKIDVIYIDPPYGKDSMGEFADTNYDNAITRDNLLSMLYNRLMLARELMSDDGVIFCSIDDRNQAYVKCLFDEVFGETNNITTFHWEKTQHFGRQKINFYSNCEYILCYAKQVRIASIKELLVEKYNENLTDAPLYNASNNEKQLIFPEQSVKFNIKDGIYTESNSKDYILVKPVEVKEGTNFNKLVLKFKSRWAQKTVDEEYSKGTKFWIKSDKFSIRTIYSDEKESNISPKSLIFTNNNNPLVAVSRYNEKVGTNENASKEVEEILNGKYFEYPKPVSLIKYLISLIYDYGVEAYRDDLIILDFFAGSGTTGQAVLEMNKADGGNRQFILCTNNEKTDTTPNGIAYDVTSKRLKRVMTGSCYDGNSDFEWIKKNEALGGSLLVYEIDSVDNSSRIKGRTAFELIDETLYGKEKFNNIQNKIRWVCENFEHTQKSEEG